MGGGSLPVIAGERGGPYRCTHDEVVVSWHDLTDKIPALAYAWIVLPDVITPSGAIDLERIGQVVLHPAISTGSTLEPAVVLNLDTAALQQAVPDCAAATVCVPIGRPPY